MKIGVIHGRFQCFHLGHLEYILKGINECDHIYIGITNYDICDNKPYNDADPVRTQSTSNPFSYYHRYMMIKDSLISYGIPTEKFDIVPFPIEFPEKICQYVPMNATFFVTIFDKWDEKKLYVFKSMGLQTEILPSSSTQENRISGTKVRECIRNGKEWSHFVPQSVYTYIIKNNLIPLIKDINVK